MCHIYKDFLYKNFLRVVYFFYFPSTVLLYFYIVSTIHLGYIYLCESVFLNVFLSAFFFVFFFLNIHLISIALRMLDRLGTESADLVHGPDLAPNLENLSQATLAHLPLAPPTYPAPH